MLVSHGLVVDITVPLSEFMINKEFVFPQIIFEAIRGPSLRSDIAIDDIHFKSGPCEGLYNTQSIRV